MKRLPRAKHERPTVDDGSLPDAVVESYDPLVIDAPGAYLILSDVHAPYHDRRTIEVAVRDAKKHGKRLAGVILNGDTLDCHDLSDHDKDPGAPRYVEELRVAKQLLAWLRGQLPRARVVVKEGNHEERLTRYVMRHAPALFGCDGLDTPSLLDLVKIGAEWCGAKRVVHLGKLNVLHGHEYRGGGGINPARWLYTKARAVAVCGHFHRSSEHSGRDVRGTPTAAWSLGCACYLHPRYMPLNEWNHGYAIVELAADGGFEFHNKRVL